MADFDPYYQWLGIPSHEQPAHYYRLLGISLFENNADVIDIAADRQMKFLAQIVDGPHVKESQRLLNELSAARICLLNPDKKAKYDARLKEELAKRDLPPEKIASNSVPEIKKKTSAPSGSRRKQAEKLLAEHEYGRAQEVLREMMAATGPSEQEDATWAKQQMAKAKAGDENMRRQAESAIEYSRKLIETYEYSDAIQLLEQFPPKFRNAKLTSILEEATSLQQEVDLLQVDISRFMAERNYVELKVAVQRFRELKPGNAKMKQLWADLTTYGNKPIVFVEPDQRKASGFSTAGGITSGQFIGGAAIVSLLFGATLYATYYYVDKSKKGTEKAVAPAEESTWKVDIQIDNPAADVTIDGQPVKITGNQTKIYLPPGQHEWAAKLSSGESKSGKFDVRKMEANSLAISTGRLANTSSEPLNRPWNTSEFQAWLKEVSTMDAERQVAVVTKRLKELNPRFDGNVTHQIENGVVTSFDFATTFVEDITPIRALANLQSLIIMGGDGIGSLSDLSPLTGTKLTLLRCSWNNISDLSPLKGLPLTCLHCAATPVTDLSPLKELPLSNVDIARTQVTDLSPLPFLTLAALTLNDSKVSDLSPLKGAKLSFVALSPKNITTGIDILRQMNSLESIGISWQTQDKWPAAEFWKKYDAGEFGTPMTAVNNEPLEEWMKEVSALPVDKQAAAVAKKLQELNPEFDGKVTHEIINGAVTKLDVSTDHLTNIAPVRALTGLRILHVRGSNRNGVVKGQLSNLSPLTGMKLRDLNCVSNPIKNLSALRGMPLMFLEVSQTEVDDLSPLQGMELRVLYCINTNIADLTPLKGMPLVSLVCNGTKISDLSALSGMPLKTLDIRESLVSDLSPLRGMQLTFLTFRLTKIVDLTPLVGMPLSQLECDKNEITDLTPLKDMSLKQFTFTPSKIERGLDDIRKMQSLTRIGTGWQPSEQWPPTEFWRKYDAGEFNKPGTPDRKPVTNVNDPAFQKWLKDTSKLTADKQLAAAAKKLQELNPGFDGKLTPKIENGAVTELEFSTTNVSDIAPVRAFPKLVSLRAVGNHLDWVPDGKLYDLTPLTGMKLKSLSCGMNAVISDLSPLRGMPLTSLKIEFAQIDDLSPLRGMKLNVLDCSSTKIADLSPLRGMPLKELVLQITNVSDLSPLAKMKLTNLNLGRTLVTDIVPVKGMQLEHFFVQETKVADLTPIAGMPIVSFNCSESEVTDLTPLRDSKLTWVVITPSKITKGMDILRQMKSIVQIATSWRPADHFVTADFWKKYDAGDFKK